MSPSTLIYGQDYESRYAAAWPIVPSAHHIYLALENFVFLWWKKIWDIPKPMPWTSSIVDANDFRTCKTLFDALAVDSLRIAATGVNRIEEEIHTEKRKGKIPETVKKYFRQFWDSMLFTFKNKQNWTWIFFIEKLCSASENNTYPTTKKNPDEIWSVQPQFNSVHATRRWRTTATATTRHMLDPNINLIMNKQTHSHWEREKI